MSGANATTVRAAAAHTPTAAAAAAASAHPAPAASAAVDAAADARRLASLKKGLLTWEAMIQRTQNRLPNSDDRKKEPAIAAVYVEYAELKKKVAAQLAAAPPSSTALAMKLAAAAPAPAAPAAAKPPSAAQLSARAALARQRAASATLGSSRVLAQRPEHSPLSPAAAAASSVAAAFAVPVAPIPPIAAISSLAAPSSTPAPLAFCAGPRHVSQQLKRQRPVGGLLARMGSLHGVAVAPAAVAAPIDDSMDRDEPESTSLFNHEAAAAQQQDRESAPRPSRDDDAEDDDDGEFDHDLDVEAEMMQEEHHVPAPSYPAFAPDAFMTRRVSAPVAPVATSSAAAAASSDPFAFEADDEPETEAPTAPARRTRGPNKPRNATATAPAKRKPAAKRARSAPSDDDEERNEGDVALESGDSDEFNSSADESAESGSDEDVPITSFAPPAAGSAAAAAASSAPKTKAARKPRSTKPAKEKPEKLRKVVSTNYVRSDAKHKIKNGTGRAGKSAKALRKEKWNKSQGIERWKSKAEWARDKKEAANDALYCDLLTPEQLKRQVHKATLAAAAAAAGVTGNDDGTDDELEGLRSFECAQFGASAVKTKSDAILDSLANVDENQSIMALPALTFKPATVSHRGSSRAALAAPLPDPSSYTPASLRALLKKTFGYADFRPGQLDAIMRVLNCQPKSTAASSAAADASSSFAAASSSSQNVLAIMPTGGGKTAIYHLLSYILPGLTLVVSPLLSLMKDQLEHLPSCLTGAIWSSEQDAKTVLALMSALSRNEIKVLFISPEKLLTQAFQTFMMESVLKRGGSTTSESLAAGATAGAAPTVAVPGISLVVIDEVHCLAEWSHNFRTAYSRLDTVLHNLLNVPRILGLTATATADTTKQVCAHLRIAPENIVRAPLRRDNLILSVSQCTHSSRFESIASLLSAPPFAGLHSLIIYVSYRNVAMALSKYLENHGFPSCAWYHAGLSPKERASVHSKFMRGKLQIVVATCAFGMGLDKRDIRGVIHANMPKSVESYIQEIGRAGRDGQLAFCHALWDSSDEEISHSLVHSQGVDRHNMHKLLSAVFDEKLRPRFSQAQAALPTAQQLSMADDGDECILHRRLVYAALDVEHLRTSMEMTEEVAGTILAKLERLSSSAAGDEGGAWIKLISCVHNTVQIGFHKTPPKVLAHSAPVIRTLLEQNHWIQPGAMGSGMGVAFDHERAASEFDAATLAQSAAASESPDYNSAEFLQLKQQKGFLSLSLVEAAMSLGADVNDVQKQIVALKARGEISVRWEKLAFLVQVCRMPSSGDEGDAAGGECSLDALVDQLLAHLSTQESKSGEKVSIIAESLKIATMPSMRCTPKDAVARGHRFTQEVARFQRLARKLPSSASLEDAASAEDPDDAPPPPEPEFFDLHAVMDAYFQSENHTQFLGQLVAHRREVVAQAASAAGKSSARSVADEEGEREAKMVRELQEEVASFVAAHGESFRCGRDVARVMHGLHAPSAAAQSKSARNTSRFQAAAGAAAEGGGEDPASASVLSPWAGSSIWGRFKSLKFPLVHQICERALQQFVLGSGAREGARNQAAEKRRQAKRQRVEQQAQAMQALKAKSSAAMIARIQPAGAAFPPAASNAAAKSTTLAGASSLRASTPTAPQPSSAAAAIASADDDLMIAASDDEREE